ncbi:claspin [Protobothrops mucrosquamatus]|uniref:claspin n=1 Tax=Protobothrops mucrosquamatus TaxID=103944 RepID=UPI0010FB3EB4|nr:claspin [Protobothrops mucrosquamatus]
MTAAAAAAEGEFHLEAQDVRTQDTSDSDSDSGQGSCEMSFRSQISKGVASVDDGADSEEEICTRKRVKGRRVLADSNSEGEDGVPEHLKAAPSDVDSTKERYNWLAVKGNKGKAGLNGDDSDAENLLPRLPEREKRKRKEEKKRKTTRQARKKGKPQEQKENAEDFPFNDSGCLLTDKELFDNGMEEEEEVGFSFQVENLEMSINTAETVKTKKQKLFLESEDYKHVMDENEELLLKESRKRLKPTKLTKEENKQLHSESQRLVREAAMTLPYYLPEAKSVQEFFKHKPRPSFQGSAMTLLKSMKTQPNLFKEESVTGNPSVGCHNNGKEQSLQPGTLDLPISGFANPLAAGSSPAEETEHLTGDCSEEDKQNDDFQTEFRDDLNSEKEGELNEVPAESIKPPEEKLEGDIVEERDAQSLELPVLPQEPIQDLEPLVEIPSDKIKKARLDRLRKLGVDLSIKPKLCSGMESFIDLDEPEPNRELEALKERFVKHAFHTAQPKTERTVSLNIIRKETTNDGKEELKADVVPVTLATEMVEDAARTKPGEKLQMLKAKLQAAMKLRRTEERQKRYALFKLDNEEVMEEEEEEEMSDELEEEEEEEEEANQEDPDDLGEMEEEHEELGDPRLEADKETDKESADEDEAAPVGLPCSAVSKPSSTESTLLLFKDNSSKIGCFLAGEKVELEEALSKRAEKQDDEDSFLLPTLAKENSHNSSFELIGSMIPSYQPCNKQMGRGGNFFSAIGTARSPSPGFFKTSFISSASKSSGKTSEPSLPIEDSQDLYNVTPEEKSPVPTGGRFQFSLEDDTQSQLLDADGFLNVGHHRNKYQSCKSRLPLASMDENAMDANMGELFDLYSGQNQHSPNPGSGKKSDMEELLNLCSGKFPSQDSPLQASSATAKLKKKRRMEDPGAKPLALFSSSFPAEREVEDEEKEEEFGEFQLLTDDHPFDSEEEDEKSEEEEEEEENDQEEEGGDELEFDEEEELKRREGRKNKFHLQDFMEDEAELSGSEGGSEDEYDGEELNEYEEDLLDEVLPADGELHDQVNKIHMKMMLDDDKRQLRLYQERYLLDGDLHNDGPGRMRRFRWKNLDDVPEGDAFHRDADSGDENENHLEETEAKWRKERFEREQWFREQSTKGEVEVEVDEDSQFMRLAKKVTNKLLQKKAPSAVTVQEIKSLPRNPFESFQPGSKPQLKNGSLLNQPRAVLQKLAAMSDLNPNAPRNSRNFVFQTLSPVKSEDVREKAKPQVKRRTLPAVALPSPKRLRLDSTSVQETRSIFQYLER